MAKNAPLTWSVDPTNPRSPPAALWAALTEDERRRIDAALPSEFDAVGEFTPEGDGHSLPVLEIWLTLERWFGGPGGALGTYVASDLPVYYPEERIFSPDIITIRNVDPRRRDRWHVLAEGRGLEFVLEATYHGDRVKDLRRNVERYAAFGIPEYFVLDLVEERLIGYRLGSGGRYERIFPHRGRLRSDVLDLELALEGRSVRFFVRGNPVLTPAESERRLAEALDALNEKLVDATHRFESEAAARAEAEGRLAALRARLVAAGLDPDEGLQ